MVKMTSYDEHIKKSKNFEKSIFSFFVPMALGKPRGRPGAGTKARPAGTGGRAAGSRTGPDRAGPGRAGSGTHGPG